jgi:hypothetical protein
MRSQVVLIDLSEGGRRVIDHQQLLSEQTKTAWAALNRAREGNLRSRKNTNRHSENCVTRRSVPAAVGLG